MSRRPALALVSALAVFAAAGRASAESAANVDELIQIVEDAAPAALQRHDVPGAAVGMVIGGTPVWAGGFGLADVAGGVPVTADTVFETASVSKPVTAWGVLKAAELGLLDLDAPIAAYLEDWQLPDSEYDASGVTVRRILAHAAGLSGGGDPGVQPGQPVPTLVEAAEGAGMEGGAIRLAYPPGAAYHYSSKGYVLLEMALEHVTGEPFPEFMEREVLAPLGMASSAFAWTPELSSRAAIGYDWFNKPQPTYEHPTHAPGGLVGTVGDLTAFLAATMAGPGGEPQGRGVLPPASVQAQLTPAELTDDASLVGLGFNLYDDTGTLVARKTGDHRGWKSAVFLVPETGAALAILTNSDRAAAGVFADIACPWSAALDGNPLSRLCGQLRMIRNVHFLGAALLVVLAVAYGWWVVRGVRRGRRTVDFTLTGRRLLRLGVLGVLLVGWWAFWYTDKVLRMRGYAPTFVTVRFDPWPTAFIWVSWGMTLLLIVAAAATFAPRRAGKDEPRMAAAPAT